MALSYIGLYSSYYRNKNNVELCADSPVVNRNYRFKMKKYVSKNNKYQPIDPTRLHDQHSKCQSALAMSSRMHVQRSDSQRARSRSQLSSSTSNQKDRHEFDDDENYHITQEYLLSRERDVSDKNGVKLSVKKLLMGDNERRVLRQNNLELNRVRANARNIDTNMLYHVGQFKRDKAVLFDKYVDIQLQLREIKKKKLLELELELKELAKQKSRQLQYELKERQMSKYREMRSLSLDASQFKQMYLQLDAELKRLAETSKRQIANELDSLRRKKLLELDSQSDKSTNEMTTTTTTTTTSNDSKPNADTDDATTLIALPLPLEETIATTPTTATTEAAAAAAASTVATFESVAIQNSEEPVSTTTGRNKSKNWSYYFKFENFVQEQSSLLQKLSKFYSVDLGKIPSRQLVHTPDSFVPYAEALQDRVLEQKIAFYPDYNAKTKKPKLSVGYYELLNSLEKFKKLKQEQSLCTKKNQHELAEHKAATFSEMRFLTKKYPDLSKLSGSSSSSSSSGTHACHAVNGAGSPDETSFAKKYVDLKDFGELKYLLKKFPQVSNILLNGQQSINHIKLEQKRINI